MRRHHVRRIPVVEHDGCPSAWSCAATWPPRRARTRAWPTSTRAAPGH
ncbi:hypothetical protein [Streptomyces galbus]